MIYIPIQVLAELSGMSDTVNCRVLDLVVKVSQLSEEHLDGVEKLGLLQPLHRIVQVFINSCIYFCLVCCSCQCCSLCFCQYFCLYFCLYFFLPVLRILIL